MGATWNLVLYILTQIEGVLTQPKQNINTCQHTSEFTCQILCGKHSYGLGGTCENPFYAKLGIIVFNFWKPYLCLFWDYSYIPHEDYGDLPSNYGMGHPSYSSSLGAKLSSLFIKKPILRLTYEISVQESHILIFLAHRSQTRVHQPKYCEKHFHMHRSYVSTYIVQGTLVLIQGVVRIR